MRVVMFSGGVGSWAAARRVADAHGAAEMTLLFCDTLMEDEDLYRFLDDAAADIGAPLVRLADGRTPWQVFEDERFLGNSRIDPCSKILKRQIADRWLTENCDSARTTIYVGIDWTEAHRFDRLRERRSAQGWTYEAPLTAAPYLSKQGMLAQLRAAGIEPPRLYAMGFAHNNCGGFCCKAGQGHFANLLRVMPERYAEHESREERMRDMLNRDVSMMTDRSGDGKKKPLTMRALRKRIESNGTVDREDIGGCGCFVDDDETPALAQATKGRRR